MALAMGSARLLNAVASSEPRLTGAKEIGLKASVSGVPLKSKKSMVGSRRAGAARTRAVLEAPPIKMSQVVQWEQGKRLQTQVQEIAPDTTTIRSLDWDRDRFDIEFGLSDGTTYNSFIIKGDKIAVIDASGEKFRELYIQTLREEVDPSKIDYIVANHTEPDHSGLIPDLINLAPNATVIGSKVCIAFLQNMVLKPFKSKAVAGGDTLDLGRGHVLEFINAPNLHWPDTMFTLDKGTGVMYTCDAFGMHYCSQAVYDEDLHILEPHFRFYYDCLMRPNARSVLTALRKINAAGWQFSEIAVGHGPLLRYNVGEMMGRYESWSKAAIEKSAASVVVLYTADYGYSDRLSQAISRGITKTGAGVEMLDLKSVDTQELVEAVGRSASVIVMTPPTAGPAYKALTTLFATVKPKQPVVIAESYGLDCEPVDTLLRRFSDLNIKLPIPPLRVKEEPTEVTYQAFEEAGTDLGQLLTQKKSIQDKRSGMPLNVSKALARISGGLYVVTAQKGASRSAMIASWVAQASFEPLGITIAVAKDRAIESLMQVGDSFVLNCLEEGNYAGLMKHFLKRFAPGADRFEGVEWEPASNGSPVLREALAFMECKVVSRMETADHWVTYAEVVDGNVAKAEGKTASHHRKVGDYY